MKELVEVALRILDVPYQFGDCTSISTIRTVEAFLKPRRLAQMYACALDIDASDFDMAALKQYQAGLLGKSNTDQRKPRTIPTEEEKDETRKRKADAPL